MSTLYPSQPPAFASLFPKAEAYRTASLRGRTRVMERPRDPEGRFPYSERHLQCVWYDSEWRPRELTTRDGEPVQVEDPGIWNLEAGPDFLDAVLHVGPDRRRIVGDVEIHIHPGAWKAHGHADDPRYEKVRAHVTYFPGTLPPDVLPADVLQIALKAPLAAVPWFGFDLIDLTAYPYTVETGGPDEPPLLQAWRPDEKRLLLEAAGQERLRRKSERMAGLIRAEGEDQALYEEVLSALGYKRNKSAFRTLARLVPVDRLRRLAAGDPERAYALLAGVADLLPAQAPGGRDDETRAYLRACWGHWSRLRGDWDVSDADRPVWRLSGIRPANHPLRRIRAAAELFTRNPAPAETVAGLAEGPPDRAAARMQAYFTDFPDSFWSHRYTFSGKRAARPVALVGAARARSILINVLLPFLAARDDATSLPETWLEALPPDPLNATTRQAAYRLFGPDHSPTLYADGLRRQGLIQVFHDFLIQREGQDRNAAFAAFLDQVRSST